MLSTRPTGGQYLAWMRVTVLRLAKEIQDTADGGAFESEDIGEGLAHHEDDR